MRGLEDELCGLLSPAILTRCPWSRCPRGEELVAGSPCPRQDDLPPCSPFAGGFVGVVAVTEHTVVPKLLQGGARFGGLPVEGSQLLDAGPLVHRPIGRPCERLAARRAVRC